MKRVAIALTVTVVLGVIVWWIPMWWMTRGDAVAGPCPAPLEEDDPTYLRRGWDWGDFGFVCIRIFPDGRRERVVARWYW